MKRISQTARLVALGFDLSYTIPFERGARIKCSQCEAVCINGVPCHERGCPNETFECAECEGGRVQRKGATCEGCIEAQVACDEQNNEMALARWSETGSMRR